MEKFFKLIKDFKENTDETKNYLFIIELNNQEIFNLFVFLNSLCCYTNEFFEENILSIIIVSDYNSYNHRNEYFEKDDLFEKYLTCVLDESVYYKEKYYTSQNIINLIDSKITFIFAKKKEYCYINRFDDYRRHIFTHEVVDLYSNLHPFCLLKCNILIFEYFEEHEKVIIHNFANESEMIKKIEKGVRGGVPPELLRSRKSELKLLNRYK